MTTDIPIPTTVSPEAQGILAAISQRPPVPSPAADDVDGWREVTAAANSEDPQTVEAVALVTTAGVITGIDAPASPRQAGEAHYFVATPDGIPHDDDRVLLFIHGGGFTFGGGATARRSTEIIAGCYGVQTWGMDYRQLPDDPYPAGLDDCIAVYRELLVDHDPASIVVAGQSGGANLTAALMLRAQ
jgi:monoterpene epsilon-lactone hydrolase